MPLVSGMPFWVKSSVDLPELGTRVSSLKTMPSWVVVNTASLVSPPWVTWALKRAASVTAMTNMSWSPPGHRPSIRVSVPLPAVHCAVSGNSPASSTSVQVWADNVSAAPHASGSTAAVRTRSRKQGIGLFCIGRAGLSLAAVRGAGTQDGARTGLVVSD